MKARMSKEAFKFYKMIERRIHIAKREGDDFVEIMMNEETFDMVVSEVLPKLLEHQYKVEFYYNPILYCDNTYGDYCLTITYFNE